MEGLINLDCPLSTLLVVLQGGTPDDMSANQNGVANLDVPLSALYNEVEG